MTYKKVSSVSTSMKVTLKILYDNGDGEDYDEAGWYWELDGYDADDGGFMSDDHGGPFKTRAQAVSDGKASVPRHLGYSP